MRNILAALTGQILGILLQFVSRKVFIAMMSEDLLGVGSVFANILSILSLAELGIGTAIAFALYQPLAEGDQAKVTAIMAFYQKIYRAVAGGVLLLGMLTARFLPYMIREPVMHLRLYYYLYLASSVLSYLCAYKRTLMIADQKSYISSAFRCSYIILLNVVQIFILITTQSFALYLTAQVLLSFAENVLISLCADRMYPYINRKGSGLSKAEKNEIGKNIRALFFHRTGSVAVTGTDSILLSVLVDLRAAAVYANYRLIFSGLNTILTQLFSAVTASVGSLLIERDMDYNYKIYRAILMLSYWLYGVTGICLIVLLNDLITIWIGGNYTETPGCILILVVHFFLTGVREPVNIFKNALGLFWRDRYKPLAEAVFNLILSIALGVRFGAAGIFGATILSALLIPFWVEPYILYKHYWGKRLSEYFRMVLRYLLPLVCIGGLLAALAGSFAAADWPQLVIKSALIFAAANLLFLCAVYRTYEFRFVKARAQSYLKRFIKSYAGSA